MNTGGATVNRDDIVSMYAGLKAHRICLKLTHFVSEMTSGHVVTVALGQVVTLLQ